MAPGLRVVAVAVALAALAGCDGDAGGYRVRVVFDPPALAEDTVVAEVAVVRSCADQLPGAAPTGVVRRVEIVRGEEASPLGDLAPGAYGLYARAASATCDVVAAGCDPIEVEAGGTGTLTVTVRATLGEFCGPGTVCAGGGRCTPGSADAGMDAGGGDAGPCSCAVACARCDADRSCVPDHEACGPGEYCDLTMGCIGGVVCAETSPECADDGDPCSAPRCDRSRTPALCVSDPLADGVACMDAAGTSGQCHDGECCIGCVGTTGLCVAGAVIEACGSGGGACAVCDDGNPCTRDACSDGACATTPDDGAMCAGGVCLGGSCCTGCVDGTTCQSGDTTAHCGTAGAACTACACPTLHCASGACTYAHPFGTGSFGQRHSCAIPRDGTLWCWGENTSGQLGLGDAGAGTERRTPTRIGTASDWTHVDGGDSHTCGRRADGSVWCWGDNSEGNLGLGDAVDRAMPTRVGTLTTWTSIAVGFDHACALRSDDTLWCWGEGDWGQLGDGMMVDRRNPTQVLPPPGLGWREVSCGDFHTCAITTSGALYCWGQNMFGQIGDTMSGMGINALLPTRVGTLNDWMQVGGGENHTCALKTDGSLWCWGENSDGQIGLGMASVTPSPTPMRIGMATTWRALDVGEEFNCALRTDDSLWCWGDGSNGQMGHGGATGDRNVPTRVGTDTDWDHVLTGEDHVCAIKNDGRMWCWGANLMGQLGLGDTVQRNSPVLLCMPD